MLRPTLHDDLTWLVNLWENVFIGGLLCQADVAAAAAVFPVSVKERGSWRKQERVPHNVTGKILQRNYWCLTDSPSHIRPGSVYGAVHSDVSTLAERKALSLSSELSASSSDVGCCARPCWEQRLSNLRGKPSPRYSHERRGGRVLQIRDDSRHRSEEQERGASLRLHWVRGPEVRRESTVST